MYFRKRLSRNPNSNRASNKIRTFSNKRFTELESFVDFASEHEEDYINVMEVLLLNHKN